MRGYFSFVLVFLSLLLVFSLISVQPAHNSSQAISIERAYGLSMNVKEAVIEAAREGAEEGFGSYDLGHDIMVCRHCQDHFCTYDRQFPNFCDDMLCSRCFREDEARSSAILLAQTRILALKSHRFDPDFSVSISSPPVSTFLKPDKLAKNGFSLDYIRFEQETHIALVSRFISSNSTLPKMVVLCQ